MIRSEAADVPASQCRLHGSFRVFHFCHNRVIGDAAGEDIRSAIWSFFLPWRLHYLSEDLFWPLRHLAALAGIVYSGNLCTLLYSPPNNNRTKILFEHQLGRVGLLIIAPMTLEQS